MIGRTVGQRYEVQERIGGGGFSVVYRGRDLKLHDAPVAIKHLVLRPEHVKSKSFPGILREMMWLSGQLTHPNIVQVRDRVVEGDDYFVILDHVYGLSLRQLESRAKETAGEFGWRISPNLTAHIIREVGSALDYAHNLKDISHDAPLEVRPETGHLGHTTMN